MGCPREDRQVLERQMLSPRASLAERSRGRERDVPECEIRTCFQRDIDRIIHSKSFRRLKHKTQVFLQPEGDHYSTRLTHTLEVARIGRTIARGIRMNEDLAEAIALGHDLGHAPFGHAGERALNDILCDENGFRHNEQSLRVVENIEKDGQGLNLTYEVRDGILCHTGGVMPATPEGRIIRLADRITYLNHDVVDAIRGGILREADIPQEITRAFGTGHAERVNTLILDVIHESEKTGEIIMSVQTAALFDAFYNFMHRYVYHNNKAKSEEAKVFGILDGVFSHYAHHPDELPDDYRLIAARDGLLRAVSDYVSGMTDKYAMSQYSGIFIPEAWHVY